MRKVAYRKAEAEEWPICPHCQEEIREIVYKDRGWLNSTCAFWCPNCRSLLSISTSFKA